MIREMYKRALNIYSIDYESSRIILQTSCKSNTNRVEFKLESSQAELVIYN